LDPDDSQLLGEYFEKVRAPEKSPTLVEGAGHFAAMAHVAQFLAAVRKDLQLH